MKKFILILLLVIFSFSFCKGQDTLVFKDGTKLTATVYYVDKLKVYFTEPPDNNAESVTKTQLSYVKYAKGFVYSIAKEDSLKNKGQKGHLVVSFGIGYSPEFDGNFGIPSPWFPVQENAEYFACSSIIPNIGATIDYGLTKKFSIGLATSYQSEVANNEEFYTTDRITRINFAFQLLKHLNKRHPNFDDYIGLRVGCSYWRDVPSIIPSTIPPYYFIEAPTLTVPSFQFLYGMRFYFTNNFGINLEAGIGSPYLVEGGITFRFKTRKRKT